MCRSVPQIATESTWHSTSSAAGRGTGTSSRISCWLGPVSTTARMRRGKPSGVWPSGVRARAVTRKPSSGLDRAAAGEDARGRSFGIGTLRLRAGRSCAVNPRHLEIDKRRDPAHAPLAADPAPWKGAEGHALPGHLGQLAAQVLEHAHVAARGAIVDVFEVTFGQRLLDGPAAHLFVLAHQVGPH